MRPAFSDYGAPELGKLTAGIGLTDLEVLVRSALEGSRRLDPHRTSASSRSG